MRAPSNKGRWKKKIKKSIWGERENYWRSNHKVETSSKRYLGPFLKWEELPQMHQRTKKLMSTHVTLHPRGDIKKLFVSRKERERWLATIEDSVDISIKRLENCPVGWGCRIHWLLLCRGVRSPPNECPGYDTKQSDGEIPAMLELWGVRSTPSLPSLPGPLWPGVVAPDKGPIYGLNRTKPCFFYYTDFFI